MDSMTYFCNIWNEFRSPEDLHDSLIMWHETLETAAGDSLPFLQNQNVLVLITKEQKGPTTKKRTLQRTRRLRCHCTSTARKRLQFLKKKPNQRKQVQAFTITL